MRQDKGIKRRGNGGGLARRSSEGLRGGQKEGLYLCKSNNFNSMGGIGGGGGRTNRGTAF